MQTVAFIVLIIWVIFRELELWANRAPVCQHSGRKVAMWPRGTEGRSQVFECPVCHKTAECCFPLPEDLQLMVRGT